MPGASTRQARRVFAAVGLVLTLTLAACSGPDEFGDAEATSTAPSTPTEVIELTPTEEPEPTPTTTVEVSPTPEGASDETPTVEGGTASTPSGDATPAADETPDANATPSDDDEEPTAPAEPINAMDALPRLEELSEGSYVVANQGERTADQLAQAYSDSTAHQARLEEWGFQQHVFREFTRQEGANEALPNFILATVNVYGSPEQADLALQWLEDLQINQGGSSVQAPDVGDAAVAITLPTAQGEQTASVYVRFGPSTYVYYAQGNDPLPEATAIAERVFERIGNEGRQASIGWSS